jgi:hypothetical protein
MGVFLLSHRHDARECEIAFAAWRGFDSPLRHQSAICSCRHGGHGIWWQVEARDPEAARALLPAFVAQRTDVIPIAEVEIP